MFSTIRPRSAFRLDGEDLRHETADEIEDEHDENQHQARSIGMVVTQAAEALAGQFALSLEYSW